MEEIIQFLAGILNREFIRAVFSNPRVKGNVVKAKLRPMEQKGELLFQLESFTKTQAFHKNLTVEETKDELAKLLEEKKKTYAEYRHSREEMRELLTAKANVDRALKMEVEQDVEKEKDHGQR